MVRIWLWFMQIKPFMPLVQGVLVNSIVNQNNTRAPGPTPALSVPCQKDSGQFRPPSPLVSCPAAEMEAVPWSDPSRPAAPLLKVGPRRPHRRVVGHVVVGGEELDLSPGARREQYDLFNASFLVFFV